MKRFRYWLVFVMLCALAGQLRCEDKKAAPVVVAPPPASYEFSDAEKLRIRELQYYNDQLEIEVQKMQVEIEKKKAQQETEINAIKSIAFEYATKHGVDLIKYVLEPSGVRFVKK